MQCPKCGFENIPGRDTCSVCSGDLVASRPAERMYPTRARERSLLERKRWQITHSSTWEAMRAVRRGVGSLIVIPIFGFREIGLSLAAIIPGLGHVLVFHNRRVGASMFFCSMIALLLAIFFYKTPFADILMFSVIALSMFCVWAVVRNFYGYRGTKRESDLAAAGIALWILAGYFGSYALISIALSPIIRTMVVFARVNTMKVTQGDTILVRSNMVLKHGDVIVGWSGAPYENVRVVGPIVGMPGDQLDLRDQVYVNGIPTGIVRIEGQSAPASITLGVDQYWIAPMPDWAVGEPHLWIESGVVRKQDVDGKVIAVTSPSYHRQWLNR